MALQGTLPFDPYEFSFSPERQFHSLKHFSVIDPEYRKSFLSHGRWSNRDLLKRMEKFGSKFDPEFVSNPKDFLKIFELHSDYHFDYRKRSPGRIELRIVFNKNARFNAIGWDTLLRIEDIDESKEIETRMRNDFPVHYIKGTPVPTLEMNMIFEYSDNSFHLITLFPGKYAPPFPDMDIQTEKEYEESVEFWKKHMFLET